jgi:hypothetical protein
MSTRLTEQLDMMVFFHYASLSRVQHPFEGKSNHYVLLATLFVPFSMML